MIPLRPNVTIAVTSVTERPDGAFSWTRMWQPTQKRSPPFFLALR